MDSISAAGRRRDNIIEVVFSECGRHTQLIPAGNMLQLVHGIAIEWYVVLSHGTRTHLNDSESLNGQYEKAIVQMYKLMTA